jgi:hypothetical protein
VTLGRSFAVLGEEERGLARMNAHVYEVTQPKEWGKGFIDESEIIVWRSGGRRREERERESPLTNEGRTPMTDSAHFAYPRTTCMMPVSTVI